MYSIGDCIDKLCIENLKIFRLRESVHQEGLTDDERVEMYNTLNIINKNRSILSQLLDDKIDDVIAGKEPNRILEIIKTYDVAKKKNQ